ncbi:hypothetical protein DFJ77DRAFT_457935 [Powellomyces hirtus]|nr:hypothetical protein DFJ77DRAFT_457935 [Powellomyces hirtus]
MTTAPRVAEQAARIAKTMFIMRGAPGSGKSSLARTLSLGVGAVLSTDDYFMQSGEYRFDFTQLGKAHEWNQARAQRAIAEGAAPIVIDNTCTQAWEARPYVIMAQDAGYLVEVVEPQTAWWLARDIALLAARNTHGVDAVTIERMLSRWEPDIDVETILRSEKPRFTPPRVDQAALINEARAEGQRFACQRIAERLRQLRVLSEDEIRDVTNLERRRDEERGRSDRGGWRNEDHGRAERGQYWRNDPTQNGRR